MFQRLGDFVSRYWLLTILFWVVLIVAVRRNTPKWDDVTHDGDLAYMPAHMPSVQGEQLLERAFPDGRSKSVAVVVLACEGDDTQKIDKAEIEIVRSFVSRFQNMLGTSLYIHSKQFAAQATELRKAGEESKADELDAKAKDYRERALNAFDEAVERLYESIDRDPYIANPAHNLGLMYMEDGNAADAEQNQALAWSVNPALKEKPSELADSHGPLPLLDVWSRYTETFGGMLTSKNGKADLVYLRLANEFMAAENIPLIETVEEVIAQAKQDLKDWPEDLNVGLSGSAAVGSDMLRSAKESMKNTEWYTVILVIVILLAVYRSPALIAVPLITIVASLLVATSLVAWLTTVDQFSGMEWWNFKIFTTTKIFVIVILFGAGTDYCLFLISRYKEELEAGLTKSEALANSLGGVGEAIAASAFTTIVGLGMMYFADFGKFRNSGPAIGLCLLVTLFACVTLAPALLRALGGAIYWSVPLGKKSTTGLARTEQSFLTRVWKRVADFIVDKPYRVLVTCTLVMLPFFFLGFDVKITYDLLSELNPNRPSKKGASILQRHFDVGQSGPVVVLAHKPGADFDSAEGIDAIRDLTNSLHMSGVSSVKSLVAPAGGKPKRGGMRSLLKLNHRYSRELYLSKEPSLDGDVARLELILGHDPFSLKATEVLQNVDEKLTELQSDQSSYWAGSRFVFAGTTAGIRDLREVTSSDNVRIQWLVVMAVLLILLVLLRRPAVCIYLILSVLFSYYVTIGATQLWFENLYGDTFQGLDWKVPLFLFVILVAIGQDYNIYLATRVFEEQKDHGLFGGLRHAIVRTGGIITSCGVIMAGTFLSMTSGSLRGIAELGFALTLGVLLDTFVVRPILGPAFLAMLFRWHARRSQHKSQHALAASI